MAVIDKNYIENLKYNDYIAWDSLVNDPMIVGTGSSGVIVMPVVGLLTLIGLILLIILT